MHSLFVLALLAPAAAPSSLVWQSDYSQAHELASQKQKPLAVFVGNGPDGWNQILRDGQMDPNILTTLSENYVLVYADRTTSTGMQTAKALDISQASGLVISDSTAKLQAFSHNGTLTSSDLQRAIEKFSDTSRVVRTTETIVTAVPASGIIQASYVVSDSTTPVSTTPVMTSPVMTAPVLLSPSMVSPNPVRYSSPVMISSPTTYTIPSSCPNGRCPNAR
jgi:hypothetical protein